MLTATPSPSSYHFSFSPATDLRGVRETLALALLGTESLHGHAQMQLDGRCDVDEEHHTVVIETDTTVGSDLARLFVGYAIQQYPDLRVRRVTRTVGALEVNHQ